jgi:hypothetical protein
MLGNCFDYYYRCCNSKCGLLGAKPFEIFPCPNKPNKIYLYKKNCGWKTIEKIWGWYECLVYLGNGNPFERTKNTTRVSILRTSSMYEDSVRTSTKTMLLLGNPIGEFCLWSWCLLVYFDSNVKYIASGQRADCLDLDLVIYITTNMPESFSKWLSIHWSQCWAREIQSTKSHSISVRS